MGVPGPNRVSFWKPAICGAAKLALAALSSGNPSPCQLIFSVQFATVCSDQDAMLITIRTPETTYAVANTFSHDVALPAGRSCTGDERFHQPNIVALLSASSSHARHMAVLFVCPPPVTAPYRGTLSATISLAS